MFRTKRRGSADPKLLAAAAFAAVGLGWGVWSMLGPGDAAEPVRGRAVPAALIPVDGAGRAAQAEFTPTRGADAQGVAERLGARAGEAAARLPGIVAGSDTAGRVASAVTGVVGSLIRGDENAFLAVLRGLGAVIGGEVEAEGPLFRQLADRLKGADVDLARLDVRAYERRGGARASRGEGPGLSEQVQEIRPGTLFPHAAQNMDERAVEVRFPFLPKGEVQERWFGMVLVWNGDDGQWQPGAFRVMTRGLEPGTKGGRP